MTDPMRIPVRTSAEGLELVEILARCGLPAALVSLPLGWQIEIAARSELDRLLLHEVTVALESSAHLLAGGLCPCPWARNATTRSRRVFVRRVVRLQDGRASVGE